MSFRFNIYIRAISFCLCLLFLNQVICFAALIQEDRMDSQQMEQSTSDSYTASITDLVLAFYLNMNAENTAENESEQKEQNKESEIEDEKKEDKEFSNFFLFNFHPGVNNLVLFNRHLSSIFMGDILLPPPKF